MHPLVIQQLDPENNHLLVETNMNQPQWLAGSNYEFTGGEGLFLSLPMIGVITMHPILNHTQLAD